MEKIRETKYNEWFRNTFLESFGHCKGKQISEKQGLIFEKYLKEDPENWRHANAFYYSGIISGKKIRLQESSAYNGSTKGHTRTLYRTVYYITIQADNTKEENEIKQEIEWLNKKFDISIEFGASDEELDEIENKIDLLCDKLNVLRFPG